ncbi:MAG: IS4 family transposase, partial [Legionella sp.]|nr:IS4 family transposase [Legionella sp.]
DKSCKNAVSGVIAERLVEGKSSICTNTGSYVKARHRLSERSIYELVKSSGVSLKINQVDSWKVYGRDLKAIDGTIITLPDTKRNNETYPKHRNKKESIGFPQIRLLGVLSLVTGAVIDYALDANKGKGTGEISLLRRILCSINEQDIVVADRLYCNFFLVHDLKNKNVDVIVPGHVQRRSDFRIGKRLGTKDHITVWKKPKRPEWMSQESYKRYPNEMQIREFQSNGVIYITTFFDASLYPKNELYLLYKRRWEVELHLNSIKTVMGMDMLSCKSPEMLRKEIGVYFLAYNIVRTIIVEACIANPAIPCQISFKSTLQLLNQFTPHFSLLESPQKNDLYIQMLHLIVTNKIGKRPGRIEPRAIKHRSKSFPTLRNRQSERQKILQERNKKMENYKDAA